MKKYLTLILTVVCVAASAVEITLLDLSNPEWRKSVGITYPSFKFAPDQTNTALVLTAVLSENSAVIKNKAWHGYDFKFADPLPAGKLVFEFKAGTMTTLWMNAVGKDAEGKPRRLDKPVNMYGSNIVKPGVWCKVEMDMAKSHISGQNKSGALESVSRIEFRLHPHKYTKPGTYSAEIRNMRYVIAE